MRFILNVISNNTELASDGEMEAIDAFNDKMRENNQLLMACGITDPETAQVFDNRGGKGEVTSGPLHVLKEFVAGFWIIEADDETTANTLAAEGSQACNRKIELRRLHG